MKKPKNKTVVIGVYEPIVIKLKKAHAKMIGRTNKVTSFVSFVTEVIESGLKRTYC